MSKKSNSPKVQQSASQLEALKSQVVQLTEALQRERADVINVRRRHEEQVSSLKTMVKADIVRSLLPVIDNFERALNSKQLTVNSKQLNDFEKGIVAIVKQFQQTLEKLGVERIRTVGEVFDPRLHEAVGVEEGDGSVERVCEELQAGYKVGDDIIRHAMVKVKTEKR